jgi:hypothetical protein
LAPLSVLALGKNPGHYLKLIYCTVASTKILFLCAPKL